MCNSYEAMFQLPEGSQEMNFGQWENDEFMGISSDFAANHGWLPEGKQLINVKKSH